MDSKFSVGNKVACFAGANDGEYGVITTISDIVGEWWYRVVMPNGEAELIPEDCLRLWDPEQDPSFDMDDVIQILAKADGKRILTMAEVYKSWAEFNGAGASDRTFKSKRIRIHKNEVMVVSDSAVEGVGNACIDTSGGYRYYVTETYEEVCKKLGWE